MKKKTTWIAIAVAAIIILELSSCKTIPQKATAVKDFDVNRYLGKWYEIARMDYVFEKNLNQVTAEYSLKDDGNIKVLNKGFNFKSKKWKSSEGKAKFRDDQKTGALKVSFFGPFYSGYNIIAIDDDYKYALVAGKNLDYLWILSRTTTLPDAIRKDYLRRADNIGYDTSKLIWVEH